MANDGDVNNYELQNGESFQGSVTSEEGKSDEDSGSESDDFVTKLEMQI